MTDQPRRRRREQVMGTLAEVELYDPVPDFDVLDRVFAWFDEVDHRFSTYKEHSEINRLHRGELAYDECSADLRYVFDESAQLWRQTDGYFDIYASGRIDPSGYVKGWSIQRASELLTEAGAINHVVEVGGDIQTRGRPAPDREWEIGVRHPWELDKVAWVLTGTDIAVATSGTYERGHHVINPRTGKPAAALRSVTLVGRDIAETDAFATAALAMGTAALGWLARLDGYESAVVAEDGTSYRSDRLPELRLPEMTAETGPAVEFFSLR